MLKRATGGRPALGRGSALGWVVAGALAIAACGGDSPAAAAPLSLVTVETQRCRQPNRFHGVGIVVGEAGDGATLVLTAGHTVEGDLRRLAVDGHPAQVVTLDRRTDLAVLRAVMPGDTLDSPTFADETPDTAQLMAPDGIRPVTIDRRVTLVVDHATDRATYRRDVVIFTPGVADGDSGSPLVDGAGRLVGIVLADRSGEGVAATAAEVAGVLGAAADADDLSWPAPPGRC